jgi:hypothetical protein
MLPEDLYFKTLSNEELWQRYCGFLDLRPDEFLDIQRSLLEEHLAIVGGSPLGRRILGENPPRTMGEFRASAPLTVYRDYEPELSQRDESSLAAKPAVWCHSSGRGGSFKWVPHSEALMDKTARNCIGLFNLSAASGRGEITVGPGMRMLTTLPPVPYTSGTIFSYLRKRLSFHPLPPPESVEGLPFAQQVAAGFEQALKEGFDVAGAVASIMVRMGQQISGQASSGKGRKLPPGALRPQVMLRLLKGYLRSRREKRPVFPKDLWNPKGIMAGGVDTRIYRKEIESYWGVTPFDVYAATETMFLGMQSWSRRFMTFLPDSVFLEFRPLGGGETADRSPSELLLIDQLVPFGLYEVVVTQFHGMPLLRYRLGDVIQVLERSDEAAGVQLPQFEVRRKIDEVINLGALCALDERTLWSAIAATGLQYTDWAAYKEYDHSETFLRLVIELKEPCSPEEVSIRVHEQLKKVDTDYVDVERYLGSNPVRVTVLEEGAFARYTEAMVREGAALAHLKPKHINPSPRTLGVLTGAAELRNG